MCIDRFLWDLLSGILQGMSVWSGFHDNSDVSLRIAARAAARTPVRRPALHPVHPPGGSGRHWPSAAEDSEPPRYPRGGCGTCDRNQVRRGELTAVAGAAKIDP